jgi:hypothetical protein
VVARYILTNEKAQCAADKINQNVNRLAGAAGNKGLVVFVAYRVEDNQRQRIEPGTAVPPYGLLCQDCQHSVADHVRPFFNGQVPDAEVADLVGRLVGEKEDDGHPGDDR